MTEKQKANYQRFETLPEGWTYATPDNESDPIKWSGIKAPPAVGTKVKVTMNQLGPGVVMGYFVEYGWFGVLVKLSKPPAWWRKQNAGNPDRDRLSHIFGAELEGFRTRKQKQKLDGQEDLQDRG